MSAIPASGFQYLADKPAKARKPAKPKIRAMSKARKALFAKHEWCDEEQAKKWHKELETPGCVERFRQLYTPSKALIECYPEGLPEGLEWLPFTGDHDHDGNLILANALAHNSPAKQQERMQKMADRANTRSRHMEAFYDTFKRNLRDFWEGNLMGFNAVKFDEEIVKSDDNESAYDAVRRQWGDAAVKMIEVVLWK